MGLALGTNLPYEEAGCKRRGPRKRITSGRLKPA